MSSQYENDFAEQRILNRVFEKEWFKRAELMIRRNVDVQQSDLQYIDFGCSACELLENIKTQFSITGMGADFSDKAVEFAKTQGFNSFVFDGNNSGSLPEQYYGVADFATSTANMEHIQNLDAMLQIVYKSLKDEGVFIFTMPNSSSIESWLNYLYFCEPIDEGHHCRFLTRSKLTQMLVMNGYDIIDEEHLCHRRFLYELFNSLLNFGLNITRPLVAKFIKTKMFAKRITPILDFNVIDWGFAVKKDKDFVPLGLNLKPVKKISEDQKAYMLDKIKTVLFEKGLISSQFYGTLTGVSLKADNDND